MLVLSSPAGRDSRGVPAPAPGLTRVRGGINTDHGNSNKNQHYRTMSGVLLHICTGLKRLYMTGAASGAPVVHDCQQRRARAFLVTRAQEGSSQLCASSALALRWLFVVLRVWPSATFRHLPPSGAVQRRAKRLR